VFKSKVPDVTGSNDLSRLFLILALISFMLEIILRKFKPPVQQVKEKLLLTKNAREDKRKSLENEQASQENQPSHVDVLLKNKRNRR